MKTTIYHPEAIEYLVSVDQSYDPETMSERDLKRVASRFWWVSQGDKADTDYNLANGIPVVVTPVKRGVTQGSFLMNDYWEEEPIQRPQRGVQIGTHFILDTPVNIQPRTGINFRHAKRQQYLIRKGVNFEISVTSETISKFGI